MAAPKSTPKDAQVMQAILRDMAVTDYEPRVVNQMLEFTYRYITGILDDARVYQNYAKRKNLDFQDVKLAIQSRMDFSFTSPPPRDLVIELSRQKNSQPLPIIKPHTGPKLPPDRYCLFACNYRQRGKRVGPRLQLGVQSMTPRLNISPQQGGATLRTVSQAVSKVSKLPGACLSLVTKTPTSPTITIVSRPSVTTSASPVSSSVAKQVT
ncbi:PREDICTED: transcription initiation factor TFIID subunit 9B-like, partial [Priapulus caudatus]|uniref:Transcription initiation factor TFIID subunit 9B-like n=1 Tax=Priapulus caudatus TaxID=37621 RepID=A0ABM1DX62_PRICU